MTNGIGSVGNSNYGNVNPFLRRNSEKKEETVQTTVNAENDNSTIDADKVLDLLSSQSAYVAPTKAEEKVTPKPLDPVTEARIAGFALDFEAFVNSATEELGDQTIALKLSDLYSLM